MPESPVPESTGASGKRASGRMAKKRLYIACQRCHSLKVKCSGSTPCQRCSKAQKGASCQYPSRDRRVTVSESYLQQLQRPRERVDRGSTDHGDISIHGNVDVSASTYEHSAEPNEQALDDRPEVGPDHHATDVANDSLRSPRRPSSRVDVHMSNVDTNISNPIHDPGRIFTSNYNLQQQFVGESTCSAFGDRILQCLDPQTMTVPLPADGQYVRNATFSRQLSNVASCKFPDRIRATLLVRVAIRFIGQDYHMFMEQDFLQRLDKMYATTRESGREHDSIWICKFFAVLALGEMYSTSLPAAKEARPSNVAGSEYFLTAVGLLQDLFEEPCVDQVETLLLFSFYSNALGRVKSAHMYSGMALRSSTALGLHRRVPETSTLSPLEQEHQCRLWWTVFIFDRSTCSKLGQPIAIQDSDVDVAMPSTDSLSLEQIRSLGGSTDHLIAYINLAQITGYIMKDIYVPSSKANSHKFVHNVRSILQRLRKWDSHVPDRLRWDPAGGVPRSVASLQLHFNQCIILTTRPVLLYVFKIKNPFAEDVNGTDSRSRSTSDDINSATISDTVRSLADSCVAAARTSNAIIAQLFVENALATCGYFDAHHLFASTLVLIISAISSPNASDSDSVQTAFQLLMMMRDNGNVIAGEYFSRLLQIQWSVNRLFTRATAMQESTPDTGNGGGNDSQERLSGNLDPTTPMGAAVLDEYDWSKFMIPPNLYASYVEEAVGDVTADPLDNPLLQAFLDRTDGSQDDSQHLSPENIGFVL